MQILREQCGLVPDAVSGRCSSSPVLIDELCSRSDIPIVNNIIPDFRQLGEFLA